MSISVATFSGEEKPNKRPVGAYFYKFYETTKSENGRSCSEWKSHEEEVLKKKEFRCFERIDRFLTPLALVAIIISLHCPEQIHTVSTTFVPLPKVYL